MTKGEQYELHNHSGRQRGGRTVIASPEDRMGCACIDCKSLDNGTGKDSDSVTEPKKKAKK